MQGTEGTNICFVKIDQDMKLSMSRDEIETWAPETIKKSRDCWKIIMTNICEDKITTEKNKIRIPPAFKCQTFIIHFLSWFKILKCNTSNYIKNCTLKCCKKQNPIKLGPSLKNQKTY